VTARFADLVTIGRVVKPQGRRGELLTEPLSDRPQRFPSLRKAYVPGPGGAAREVTVSSCWPHKGRFVLKLEGVDTIDAAEGYRGLELRIPEEELDTLPPGAYYHHQLLGLQVEGPDGRSLGVLRDIMETGGEAPVLVVRGARGEERLVPFAAPFVKRVDPGAGRLVLEVPEPAEE
jgi:16S rRNA processing protein RimM